MKDKNTPVLLFELANSHLMGAGYAAESVSETAVKLGVLRSDSVLTTGAGVTAGGSLLLRYEMNKIQATYVVPKGSWKLRPKNEVPSEAMKDLGELYSKIEKQTSLLLGAA